MNSSAASLTIVTTRGAQVHAVADFPPGVGPFPTIVLAPGQGYHLGRPALHQTAMRMVAQGIVVYRFDWAYYTAMPDGGSPSDDLADELEDMRAVVSAAQAEPRVDRARVSVGGKSLGSIVAWRVLAADESLRSGLLLTPVCSHVPEGQSASISIADENYPEIAAQTRPLLFISGDRDPLCAPAALYRWVAGSGGIARVAIVGGDHGFENRALGDAAADAYRHRSISAVARLAADFIAEVSAEQVGLAATVQA